jgi:hypothetical protein
MVLESNTDSVWYAVYGSNLLRGRFMCYLEGRPFPGQSNARVPRRCNAGTSIQGDKPFHLEFELYFARDAPDWGRGGVAFVGIKRVTPPPTLGRAYLLTLQQLTHVATEENGGSRFVQITKEVLFGSPVQIRQGGWYNVLLPCGLLDGIPVVTITGWPDQTSPRRPPSENYLSTIQVGLRETYPSMSLSEIDEYIRSHIPHLKP